MEEYKMGYVIGIDGGGTKTEVVLANLDGKVIAKSFSGPTNPNLISDEELEQNFTKLLRDIQMQAPESYRQVTSLFAGISGAATEEAQRKIECILRRIIFDHVHILVQPDAINALYSGTYGTPGIVQIAGTGSITYGINEQLEHHRIGGWGYLFGDEGSGFDLGKRAVIAVLTELDGFGAQTTLTEMLLNYFNVSSARELIERVYRAQIPKDELSPLSKIVFQAYKEKDTVAIEIVMSAAKSLTQAILALQRKHYQKNSLIKVVLCGGVFHDKTILPRLIEQEMIMIENIQVVQPEMQPVGGSIIGAYLMQDRVPDDAIIDNLIKTLKKGE